MNIVDKIMEEGFSKEQVSDFFDKKRSPNKQSIEDMLKKYMPDAKFDNKILFKLNKLIIDKFGEDKLPEWMDKFGKRKNIALKNIIFSQRHFDIKGTRMKNEPIHAVYVDNNYILIDGNHRCMEAMLSGEKEIDALVLDLNDI